MSRSILRLEKVCKSFESYSLQDFSLDVPKNAFLTLLGPSGCGKTTILRLIGGFETSDSGSIFFEGQDISTFKPHKREFNTVFQEYALFPHMNVFHNVAFGLRMKKVSKLRIKQQVFEVLEKVGLKDFAHRHVHSLSGGQMQRVAIARAIVNQPKVLLLDEPLAALDLKMRREMQQELKKLQKDLGITFIFVTHDQEEALALSDRIVVMNHGLIQQVGTPVDVYNEPINAFVADFIGESNLYSGIMLEDYKVQLLGEILDCVDKGFLQNEEIDVVIRPEDVSIVLPAQGLLEGVVESITFQGVHYEISVRIKDYRFLVHSTKAPLKGQRVGLYMTPEDIHIMEKSELSQHIIGVGLSSMNWAEGEENKTLQWALS